MNAEQYILARAKALKLPTELVEIKGGDSFKLIKQKLLSKKFRKLKATPACEQVIDRVVKQAIKNQMPIRISTLFGGNKLWRFDEAPEVDWAELFNLFYYIDWMKTVAAVHKPGVEIDYYSQDISIESLDGVPRSETDKYSETFRQLLEWVKPYLPDGISIVYRRHFDDFDDPDDYYKELEQGKREVLKDNGGKLPSLTEEMRVATELNVKLKPGQDDDPNWREKVELEHQAIFRTKTLGKHLSEPDRISLCPTNYEDSDSIITGSTKRSYAKFWAAVGALEKDGDKYNELVLTPKQLSTAKFEWEAVKIPGLDGKNFNRIRTL